MASKKTAGTASKKTAASKPTAPRRAEPKQAAPKTAAPKTAAPKTAAPKTAAPKTAAPKTAAPKTAAPKTAARKPAARKPAAPKTAARKPAAPKTAARRPAPPKKARSRPAPLGTDPEGFFVARVRGEDAVREAPRSLLERAEADEEPTAPLLYDEGLGELPWSYGDDLLVALPRDPRTLFVYWDNAAASLEAGFRGMDQPRVQIWVFAEGDGWERVRTLECALESRGYYVHDLEPGRRYRAELHIVDRRGQERLLGHGSNSTTLPPLGASPLVDDRFVTIPWDLPLGRLLGPGAPGGPFSEAARALLARLSDWSRLQGPGVGPGGRPTSQGGPPGAGAGPPTSPSSPFGPLGGEGR